MKTSSSTTIGRIAIALAVVAVLGLVFIALFYALFEGSGGPFGTLNDICVALGGILSGGLVWGLYSNHRTYAPRMSRFALGSGLVGACLVPIGSGLAIFNITGWFLAGLVTTFGYALIGLWLLGLNYSARGWPGFPHRLALIGIVAGGVMVIGILSGPGIVARIDAADSAQWFVLAALYVGGLGWNILYTIWCIWLGRLSLSKRLALQLSAAAVPGR
ncbi:MAG: hypothetical protein WA996_10335 [Candidatus Promineifilaceae bacterium]